MFSLVDTTLKSILVFLVVRTILRNDGLVRSSPRTEFANLSSRLGLSPNSIFSSCEGGGPAAAVAAVAAVAASDGGSCPLSVSASVSAAVAIAVSSRVAISASAADRGVAVAVAASDGGFPLLPVSAPVSAAGAVAVSSRSAISASAADRGVAVAVAVAVAAVAAAADGGFPLLPVSAPVSAVVAVAAAAAAVGALVFQGGFLLSLLAFSPFLVASRIGLKAVLPFYKRISCPPATVRLPRRSLLLQYSAAVPLLIL